MENVIAAFPKRPLRIDGFHQTKAAVVFGAIGIVVLVGIVFCNFAYVLPAVIDDIRYRDAPYVAGKFEGGSCQSKLIISICSVKLKYRPDGGEPVDKELTYLLFVGDLDTERPFVVHMQPSNPDHIATSWGEASLTNRVISQLVVASVIVFLIYAAIKEQRRRREDAAARQRIGQRPAATFVTVVEHKIDRRSGITFLTYAWGPQGKTPQTKKTRFPKNVKPFFVDDTHVLALTDGIDVAVLDAKLGNVDLTDHERDTVVKAQTQRATA
jgi:hypothetical protein